MAYREGDSYLIDDETGFKIRNSQAVKRWDGAVVHRNVSEPRHPQDLIRARRDRELAIPARPRPADLFIGPLTTQISGSAAIRATVLPVLSSVRMLVGDRLNVMLDNGDTFQTYITEITDTEHITVSPAIPSTVSDGNVVVNYTAISEPTLP